jgi:hypothetical protein
VAAQREIWRLRGGYGFSVGDVVAQWGFGGSEGNYCRLLSWGCSGRGRRGRRGDVGVSLWGRGVSVETWHLSGDVVSQWETWYISGA